MHPRDAPLWANVACGVQLAVVRPAGETDYDLVFPGDDRGGALTKLLNSVRLLAVG